MRLAAAVTLILLVGGAPLHAKEAAVEMTEPYIELAACQQGVKLSREEIRSLAMPIAAEYRGEDETPWLVDRIRRDAARAVEDYRKP